ncbi:MAG: DEAD/DEAH box helicase [Planctomycetes bacterium]|nr:DEAD/DEAH box helicase [Planctomycetota bacterium]MCB9903264.1 DEAD/DEAH box helicase [Planctomycetota bacterium]
MTTPNRKSAGRRSGSRGRSGSRPAKKVRAAVEPLHPTSTPPDIEAYRNWDLPAEIQDAIAEMGITKPTPIQALAIPPGLERKDIIAQAETGTGKTLAFGVPMMSLLDSSRVSVLGLALCPTRELAEQVADVLGKLGAPRGLSVALIVGGEPAGPQVDALKQGSQVVVGTPGRVLDLYQQGFLSFPWTEFVVLDEADEMLEIGFIDDVKKILSFTPDERTTLLFSATFPPDLLRLAREYTSNPAEIATASGVATVDNITQEYCVVDERDRPLALIRMIEQSAPDDVFLVFCERRTDVERLMRRLERERFSVKALHGGYDQASRFRVMSAFRTGEVKCLVATDVASRGLDVKHVTHVVNYGPPRGITQYTHRIGRTGRAGRDGNAVTILSHDDMRKWRFVEREATWEIPEVPAPGRNAPRREDRPRRESRDRDDSAREERPRRRGQDRQRTETEDRPRRETRGRGDREERPRRSREDRDRRESSERPRRESSSREREPREERPRRQREERPRRERETEPRREREDRPARREAPAPAAKAEVAFGAAIHEPASQPAREKERKAPSEPKPERREKPRRESTPPPAADGGFGAGI